jgi:D-sedoheptulose 7-phosphate isomerase
MDFRSVIQSQLNEAREVLDQFAADPNSIAAIQQASAIISGAIITGNKVISCGNGGSMSDAIHFAEELSGRFRDDRRGLPGIAISDPGHITCVANDYGFDHVFSRYVEAVGRPGDVLLAISTSGNSRNVLLAAELARKQQMKVVALTGKNGGKLASLADVEIRVAHSGYSDRIQEVHIKVIHILILLIEKQVL